LRSQYPVFSVWWIASSQDSHKPPFTRTAIATINLKKGHFQESCVIKICYLWKEKLNNLLEKTSSLSIDDKTKKFIVRKIKDILNVIDNYQIRGSSGLDKVIKKSLGDILIHLSIHPEEKEKLTVLINTILKVNGLINAAEKFSPLIQDAVKLLLGGN
jgi:Asp-tRNA(Asn)/Glu-tRNA(Gln) amidotransferase C subunit